MSYTLIGDLHLVSYSIDYLNSQIKFLDNLLSESNGYQVIFLGDIFHNRNPKAIEVLEFRKLLDRHSHKEYVILRGNHDTIDRSESNKTILEVFRSPNVRVVTDAVELDGIYYIPHYEDEETILGFLKEAEKRNSLSVVGHFGYKGLLAPEGFDFNIITENDFKLNTVLGHIHSFRQNGKVTTLGVPYSTSFAESNTKHYFMQVDRYWKYPKFELIPPSYGGPCHYIISENDLGQFKPSVHQLNYVRILSKTMDTLKIAKLMSNKHVKHYSVIPVSSENKHSFYWRGRVEDLPLYVDDCETDLDKNKLKKLITDTTNTLKEP